MNKKIVAYFSTVALLLPSLALAAADEWLVGIINNLLNRVVWPLFSGLVVIMFLWAGVLYFFAHGDPTKVQKANMTVIWAIVGVFVGLVSYSAINIIRFALGF